MIVGFGSAHIDILATVTGDPKTKDRIGKVSMDIGGTGGNIAINCATLGVPVRFVTALNGSAHSRIIVEHLEKAGIDVMIHEDRTLPMAAFVAQINLSGDMDSAISCMPVESVQFSESFINNALEYADIAFGDCNLSEASLHALAAQCAEKNLPFFVAAVSEEKALRAMNILRDGAAVEAVFLNRREAEYVKRELGLCKLLTPEHTKAMEDILLGKTLKCKIVITEGQEGAILVDKDHLYRIKASNVQGVKSLLGAGDAFMAGALSYFVVDRGTLLGALKRAAFTAADVVLRENCSLAEADAIDRAIDLFHDEARKDGLTQIYNRSSTQHFGEKMLSKSTKLRKPFAAIILDIDHFKSVNDTWGHSEGDNVIKAVASIVQQAMRESDICGRWGGEEFVCFLPGACEDVAMKVAERIRANIEAHLLVPRPITVSVGVAMAAAGVELLEIVAAADLALYRSKRTGRNKVTLHEPDIL